ncbi:MULTISPECIES: threonine/serine dehydratase [unclassified Crossiella]|uniref:threonine ammonia-lyase n=1 Tax=unclassified Crossiella TaxID=2620835 RepID=UPI001FFF8538|nr:MULTISPECIES: threonine/serine dehydratase [unclassified Crossiella]MCK2241503.1 threonine/serine dehydratase [Crossiella sp. S99.2]MCK2255625.1 threonine/serine dehydratase [Crossiella sp. S99.1]
MTTPALQLGHADVSAAADRIAAQIRHTPLLPCLPGLRLKAEHRQRSGSFKLRGAANALLGTGVTAVVAGSSGNHGIAVATLGARLGVTVTVVMAAGASPVKAVRIRELGADIVAVPGGVADRERHARELAANTGAFLLPSSDHDLVVAGAGTVALEILADAPETDTIFVPTGGGGLLAGSCLAALGNRVRVIGVEPAACRRYARSLAAGQPVELPPPDTIADGLRGQRPGEVPFPIIQHRVDDLIGVSDEAIRHALDLLRRNGVNAEPSGAVALAGALRAGWTGTAVAIVSGGNTTAKGQP